MTSAESFFEQTARQLLDAAGRPDVRVVVRQKALQMASAGPRAITADAGVADLAADVQSWVAAHETAHVALDHLHTPPRVLALAGALITAAIALVAAGTVLPMVIQARTAGLIFFGLTLLILVLLFTACPLAATEQRKREREADDLAGDWGYPVTPAVVDQLEAVGPRPTRSRLRLAFRKHDSPAQRFARSMKRPVVLPTGPSEIEFRREISDLMKRTGVRSYTACHLPPGEEVPLETLRDILADIEQAEVGDA